MYTKACGVEELWAGHVIGDAFSDLFAGVACPDGNETGVAEVLGGCAAGGVGVEGGVEVSGVFVLDFVFCMFDDFIIRSSHFGSNNNITTSYTSITTISSIFQSCSTKYYKIADEFNGQSTLCPPVNATNDEPLLNTDLTACQAQCDSTPTCDTIEFNWRDPAHNWQSSCHLRNCADFDTATCSMSPGKGKDIYTKACGAEENWSKQVVVDGNGLFAAVQCTQTSTVAQDSTSTTTTSVEEYVPYIPVDCTGYSDEGTPEVCVERYYKISDEFNGLATSCAAVDQAADPVIGLDQAGCQHACDTQEGCDTINFRWKDPNFNGTVSLFSMIRCGAFSSAV